MSNKILIVDDEESLRLYYEEELKAEGYDILTAKMAGSHQQVEWKGNRLIVLDMSSRHGWHGDLGRILEEGRKIPIILHARHGLSGIYELGADAYITKSADVTELKNKVWNSRKESPK
jgi:DNA-binding response OmpR family regulator